MIRFERHPNFTRAAGRGIREWEWEWEWDENGPYLVGLLFSGALFSGTPDFWGLI